MTYARERLSLAITAVGSLVTLATIAVLGGIPQSNLSTCDGLAGRELLRLAGVIGLFMLWLMPLDFLGKFLLTRKFQKSEQSFVSWLSSYIIAVSLQAVLFVFFGTLILLLSQRLGAVGGGIAISLGIAACFVVCNRLLLNREVKSEQSTNKLLDAIAMIQSWQIFVPRTDVVEHKDVGFTGGIVGVGKHTKIVIPKAWLTFSREQLATAIARRAIAIDSGSYTRGLVISLAWNVLGFLLCSLLPGAGIATVAGLVTTVCGFTLWSFFGLLTLPTVSRNTSLEIDQVLAKQGVPSELIAQTAFTMDQMQDGESERPALIETIFRPVPNVTSRNRSEPIRRLAAWNVARTTLFFSWACHGFLSRSVHCNVRRPELWTMLPSE